ncbi:MAG TPA: excinuclease ABC subunit UvrC [Candidatus Angelobacter sp.]|nr:excinuclease ABC subunit UvrC [Candidatus Angelobacter sp.]
MNQSRLKTLPLSPGVYFHKDKNGEIIYIGKAAILKNRVKQYFQNTRDMDAKTRALVAEIADTDWVQTESEIDALFLEAEMVKRYMPRYNILLRDDKSLIFVRIDMNNQWPFVSFTRNPSDDGADYFGPYYNSFAVKKALRYLRRVFSYYTKFPGLNPGKNKPDLDAHLGLSPVDMKSDEYKANLRGLISYIKGNRKKLLADLERDMKIAAKKHDFELAAIIRNKIHNLRELQQRIMFGDKEFLDISKDKALADLKDLLGLAKIPARIEGYDISHMSGTNVVASMVVFTNGVSDREQYRKFKTRIEHNNDFYNMNETITRRLSQKNLKNWGKPDLVLIDGGKGQLDATLRARDKCGQEDIPFIGMAKKFEQIIITNPKKHTITPNQTFRGLSLENRKCVVILNLKKLEELNGYVIDSGYFSIINLPNSTHIIKLLQRVRDESHRFAISYHTVLKRVKQTSSSLDKISGIGPKTRSKLIRKFGSIRGLKNASESEIAAIIGPSKTRLVLTHLVVTTQR